MSDSQANIIGRTTWLLRQFRKQLWVRAALFSLGAVLVALLAAFVGPYIPYTTNLTLAAGSVDHILNILASSMLAVTTFSLSIMVSAYSAATANVTPRSTKLLLADSVAQNTLATFVGSFLFSIVGIIGLAMGIYEGKGRVILFIATLVVLLVIVATLLIWIEQLGKFGRVGDTILRVEEATTPAFRQAGSSPRLGGMRPVQLAGDAQEVFAAKTGMIVHIDMSKLDEIAGDNELSFHIDAMPGSLVHPRRAILRISPRADDDLLDEIRACFSIGSSREFEQDPRFGAIVLSEIASRALSPAMNDPGTAIEVLSAGLRVFLALADAAEDEEPVRFSHVHAPDLDIADLFQSFFSPIGRDADRIAEVQVRMAVVLTALASRNSALFGEAATTETIRLAKRSATSLPTDAERDAVARAIASGGLVETV